MNTKERDGIVDLIESEGFRESPVFERISKIVTISRHWAAGNEEVRLGFGRIFFGLLEATAAKHGFDNFDEYLSDGEDEASEALGMIMVALIDDEIGELWEAAVPVELRNQYMAMARDARVMHPEGVKSVQAMNALIAEPATN